MAPTSAGFWAAWLPFTLPQAWPFSWWIACVVDHYSRRVMGFAVFCKEPSSIDIRQYLARAIGAASQGTKAVPKYIVSEVHRVGQGPSVRLLGVQRVVERKRNPTTLRREWPARRDGCGGKVHPLDEGGMAPAWRGPVSP